MLVQGLVELASRPVPTFKPSDSRPSDSVVAGCKLRFRLFRARGVAGKPFGSRKHRDTETSQQDGRVKHAPFRRCEALFRSFQVVDEAFQRPIPFDFLDDELRQPHFQKEVKADERGKAVGTLSSTAWDLSSSRWRASSSAWDASSTTLDLSSTTWEASPNGGSSRKYTVPRDVGPQLPHPLWFFAHLRNNSALTGESLFVKVTAPKRSCIWPQMALDFRNGKDPDAALAHDRHG